MDKMRVVDFRKLVSLRDKFKAMAELHDSTDYANAAADLENLLRGYHDVENMNEFNQICQICCDHEYDSESGNSCEHCGKDGTEEVMSALYDQAKDTRKYGE